MATNIENAKKNKWLNYLKVFIMAVIVIGIGLLPPFGQITPLGMKVLGIFIGGLFGWCVIDVMWVSMFLLIALGLTCSSISETFIAGWGYEMTIASLAISLFCGALDSLKFTDLFCNWCITRNIVKGRPWILITMLLIAGALIGAFAGSFAAIFILWSVIMSLAGICGYQKGCKEMGYLMAMVVVVPQLATNSMPYQLPALFFNGILPQEMEKVSFLQFLIYQSVICFITVAIIVLIGKYVLRLDYSRFNISEEMCAELKGQDITYKQKVGMVALVVFVLGLVLPSVLPDSVPGIAILQNMGIIGMSCTILIILLILRDKDGSMIINVEACYKAVPWSIVWLMAAIPVLSSALQSADTGIMDTVLQYTMPIFQDMNMIMFYVGSAVILGILTQVTINMVLGAVFVPFLCTICIQMGGNPYTLFMMIFATLNTAFLTPAASPAGGLMNGHEWIGKHSYPVSLATMIILYIVLAVVGIPLGNIMF